MVNIPKPRAFKKLIVNLWCCEFLNLEFVPSRYGIKMKRNWNDSTFRFCIFGSYGNFLSDFGEGVPPRECLNLTSEAELDIARSRVLSAQKPSGEIENQILNAIDSESEFFKWNIEFVYNQNLNKFQTQIKSARCLLDGKSWAGAPRYRSRWLGNLYSKSRFDYEITRYLIETKLNSQLNPVSSFETSGSSLYEIEFSPYDAFVKGETFVNFSFISNSDDSISGTEGEQSESTEPVPSC